QTLARAESLVQKSGARMRQQLLGSLQSGGECSAHFLHRRLRQFADALRLCGIDQQFGCELFQIVTRFNSSNSLRGKHDAVNVIKISGLRTSNDRYTKTRGLQRILSTVRDKTAAQKCESRQTVKQTQLSHGVGDVHRCVGRRYGAITAAHRYESARLRQRLDDTAALRMPGNDDGESARDCGVQDDLLLAGMRARWKES